MPSTAVIFGDPLPLSLTLWDGATGLYPQAHVYDDSDVEVGGSPFDLTEVDTGRYTHRSYTPSSTGLYTAKFIVYTDASHTLESSAHGRTEETFWVTPLETNVTAIKAKTDLLNFIGGDVAATLDGETVDISSAALLEILQGAAEGNVQRKFEEATVQVPARNVEVGRLDYIDLELKADSDPDWSSPIKTWRLYCHYKTLGDYSQSRVGSET